MAALGEKILRRLQTFNPLTMVQKAVSKTSARQVILT
jgi:hypothetical protein